MLRSAKTFLAAFQKKGWQKESDEGKEAPFLFTSVTQRAGRDAHIQNLNYINYKTIDR